MQLKCHEQGLTLRNFSREELEEGLSMRPPGLLRVFTPRKTVFTFTPPVFLVSVFLPFCHIVKQGAREDF